MGSIKRLVLPLIRKNLRLILSLILISSLGIGIVIGLSSSYKCLKNRVLNYMHDYNYPDVILNTELALKKEVDVEEIKKIQGVEDVYLRLSLDFSLTHNDNILSCRMFSYSDTSFMKMRIVSETNIDSDYKVSVDYKFSRDNKIKPGDIININIYGYKQDVYVEKIIALPEDISVKQNDYVWNGSTDFGYIYLNENVLKTAELDGYFNQILLLNDGSVTDEELLNSVKENIEVNVNSTKVFEEMLIVKNMHYNIDPLKSLSSVVPYVFYFVSVLVSVLFIYQIVSRYKKEIGILLTMGYRKKDIYLLFGYIGLFVALFGSLGGITLGYLLNVFSYWMYIDHFLILFTLPFVDVGSIIFATTLSIVFTLCASVFSAYLNINKLTPLEAIASSSSDTSSKGLKLKGNNPSLKIEVNRTIRNFKSNLISILCVAVSFALIMAGFSFRNAKDVIMDDFFSKRMTCDALVYLDSQNINKIQNDFMAIDGVSKVEVVLYSEMEVVSKNGKKENGLFNAVSPSYQLVNILGTHHNVISMPSEGMVIEKHLADKLDVKKGDYVKVNGNSILVSEISDQDVFRIQYISIETMEECSSSYKSVAAIETSKINQLKKECSEFSYYQSLTDMEAMRLDAIGSLKISDAGIVIIVAIAIVLGFAIVVNIKEIELFKEIKSIVVKRTLGYSLISISNVLIAGDLIRTFISFIIGVPLGIIFASKALSLMDTILTSYPYVFSMWVELVALLFILGFTLVTHLVMMISIKKLPLVEYIKDKE